MCNIDKSNSSHQLLMPFAAWAVILVVMQQTAFAQGFNVNPHRFDPYKNFKFRVKFENSAGYVTGISFVSPLRRSTAVVTHREGRDQNLQRKSPGLTKFEPITLRRGVTHDTDFEQWANKVWNFGAGSGGEVSLKDFRKNIVIDLYNEAGQRVRSYKVYRCWPSEYQAMFELDANGNEVLIESLTLQHEGWERDSEVGEPTEPSFNEPDD